MSAINYGKWIKQEKEYLIDMWEEGFYLNGNPIEEKCYEDFVKNAWEEYQESKEDIFS